MNPPKLHPSPAPIPAPEPELFDTQLIRDVVGFVFRGIGRHRLLALFGFLTMAGLGVLAGVFLPRTYHVESRLLANNNDLIRALGNPRSSMPVEDPTRAARELVFAHDNLVTLIKQTNLMKSWEETRPAVVKLKDKIVFTIVGAPTDEERIDAMVGLLEKKLQVTTDQQTVTISIDWHDAQMAYLLVETAQQNFLETRHVTEMTAISEALSILEMHGGQLQKMVDDALQELERVRETRRKGPLGAPPALVASESGGLTVAAEQPKIARVVVDRGDRVDRERDAISPATEQELAQLKFLLNSKKRALADLEDFRSRRVAELNAQLAEQKVQYADQHPIVLDMKQRIAALKLDSPQMSQVKNDIDALEHEYRRKGGKDPDALVEPTRRTIRRSASALPQLTQTALTNSELAEDPLVEFSRNNLRVAAAKYEELLMRIDSARIEQDTARAAFKYRYSVVRPASVPKKPLKPLPELIIGVTGVLAVLCLVVIGALRDWSSGRLVEPWQVERALDLPVLARVRAS